jgi:hypothetical protein
MVRSWAPNFGGPTYIGNGIYGLPSTIAKAGGAGSYYNIMSVQRLAMQAWNATPNPTGVSGFRGYFSVSNGMLDLANSSLWRWTEQLGDLIASTSATNGNGSGDGDAWYEKLLPVGIIFGVGADGFVGGGVTVSTGGVLITRGPDKGKVVYFLDRGVGFGLDLSGQGQAGLLFYTGDAKNFTQESIPGTRVAVSFAVGLVGGTGFMTPEDNYGGQVIGVSGTYGPGINPLVLFGIPVPFTINVNYGGTDTFKKK